DRTGSGATGRAGPPGAGTGDATSAYGTAIIRATVRAARRAAAGKSLAGWVPGRHRRPPDDAGMLTPSAAAVFPVVLLLIMAIFQGVVYCQAGQLAQAAASEGARVARLHGGSAEAGDTETRLLLAQTDGDWLLSGPAVTTERTGQWTRVTVDGTAPTFIPFLT